MMTVRFPTGFSVQFNSATYVRRSAHGYTDLYTKKDGDWIAQVPNDAVIEAVQPCRTYMASFNPEKAIDVVLDAVGRRDPALHADDIKTLKARLADFDARRGDWK